MYMLLLFLTITDATFATDALSTVIAPFKFPMLLGRGYNIAKDTAAADLFPKEVTDNAKTVTVTKTSVQYQLVRNTADARNLLDVSGKFALDVKAGNGVGLKGSGAYLKDISNRDKYAELLVKVNFFTNFQSIFNASSSAKADCSTMSIAQVGSHYVRSVRNGGELLASLRFIANSKDDKQKIEGAIEASVGIKGVMTGAEANFKKLEASLTSAYRMEIKLYATADIDQVPQNMEELLDFIKIFPARARKSNPNGVSLQAELVPVRFLRSCNSEWKWKYNRGLDADIGSFEAMFDDILVTRKEYEDWQNDLNLIDLSDERLQLLYQFGERLLKVEKEFRKTIGNMDLSDNGSSRQFDNAIKTYSDNTGITLPSRWRTEFQNLKHKVAGTGGWCEWEDWSKCLKYSQRRKRFCGCPAPIAGGKTCPGASIQSKPCGVSELSANAVDYWLKSNLRNLIKSGPIRSMALIVTRGLSEKFPGKWNAVVYSTTPDEKPFATATEMDRDFYFKYSAFNKDLVVWLSA